MLGIRVAAGALLAGMLAACQDIPKEMSVADYCANTNNAQKDVCKVNVEIDGQRKALAETNMTVQQARSVADNAMSAATRAQQTADNAMTAAAANAPKDMQCETRTVQKSKVGSCSPGYKLVSCSQTRYTRRAGRLSFLRQVDDGQCRFNERVLEIQVRCCAAGNAPEPMPASIKTPPPPPPAPTPGTSG